MTQPTRGDNPPVSSRRASTAPQPAIPFSLVRTPIVRAPIPVSFPEANSSSGGLRSRVAPIGTDQSRLEVQKRELDERIEKLQMEKKELESEISAYASDIEALFATPIEENLEARLDQQKNLEDKQGAIEQLILCQSSLEKRLSEIEKTLVDLHQQEKALTLSATAVRLPPLSNSSSVSSPQPVAASSTTSALSVTEDPLLQAIAESIFTHSQELFENVQVFHHLRTDQREKILSKMIAIFSSHIEYSIELDPHKKISLNLNKQQKIEEFFDCLKEHHVIAKKNIDSEEIILLETIKANYSRLSVLVESRQRDLKLKLIRQYEPSYSTSNLSSTALDDKYKEVQGKAKKVNSLQKHFDHLIELAHLRPSDPEFPLLSPESYKILVRFNPLSAKPFQISCEDPKNYGMGYSLFHLLVDAGMIDKSKSWDGEQVFDLSEEDLQKITESLARFNRWCDDFKKIMQDLLLKTDEPESAIELGQKAAFEVLSSIQQTTEKGKRLLGQLRGYDQCLLLAQVSLNIENYPEKDFLKEKIEEIYRQEGMQSKDGKRKQFVIGTYRTNLDVDQLKKISRRLNRLLKMQQFFMLLSGGSSLKDAIAKLIVPNHPLKLKNESEVFEYYYINMMRTGFESILSPHEMLELEQTLRREFKQIGQTELDRIDLLEKKYESISKDYLEKALVPFFKTYPPAYSPTPAQITSLYGSEQKKTYGQTSNVFRDIGRLFAKLETAPAVASLLRETPTLKQTLGGLKNALETRIETRYHLLEENGWPSSKKMMREAIESLEIYVASVVYEKATPDSIKNSLIQMIGLDIRALNEGCDEGLTGRIKNLLVILVTSTQVGLNAHMIQYQKECLDRACYDFLREDLYEAGNSSHFPNYLAELLNYLSIARPENVAQKSYVKLSSQAKKIFDHFLKKYTQMEVYKAAKSFFEHTLWILTLERGTEEDDRKVYDILKDLGFGQDDDLLDKQYRINGEKSEAWQYAFIQQDLTKYLPSYLVQKGFLVSSKTDTPGEKVLFQRAGDPPHIGTRAPQPYNHRIFDPRPQPQPAPVYVPPPVYNYNP